MALSFGQPGTDCSNPYLIDSLPFVQTGFTTEGYGNDYLPTDACGSSYMSGNDFVFSYSPSEDQTISVQLTNTKTAAAIFVTDGFPNNILTSCLAIQTSNFVGNPYLSDVFLPAGGTYYIIISTWDLLGAFPSTTFDIKVKKVYDNDLQITSVLAPHSSCMGAAEVIGVECRNMGLNPSTEFVLHYTVNGVPVDFDSVSQSMQLTEYYDHYFSGSPNDFSVAGFYDIAAWVTSAADEDLLNDTAYRRVYSMSSVDSFPYFNDFETDTSWITEWSFNRENTLIQITTWQQEVPQAPIISHASSGSRCWVTNATGDVGVNEKSTILAPCFDFSGLQYPLLEMDIWYETGIFSRGAVEYSVNKGVSWTVLGNQGEGTNWYNTPVSPDIPKGWTGSSGGWITVSHTLDNLGGYTDVMIRVRYDGNIEVSEGIAVDNFRIYESPVNDLKLQAIKSPGSSCNHSDSVFAVVSVMNTGLQPQVNFGLEAWLNDSLVATELVADTVFSYDSLSYTFTTPIDLSQKGLYNLKVSVVLTGDENDANNTDSVLLQSFDNYNPMGYFEDFESGNGGWYTSGEFNTWEWGSPSDSIIDHAFSGTQCWGTNLGGLCSELEESYLESPCFDFTESINPYVALSIWYEMIYPGYIQLQYTINDGNSWILIDSDSDSTWYNQGHSWNGLSGDWERVSVGVPFLAGEPEVRFRIFFGSVLASPGAAFDDFSICESPSASFIENIDGLEVSFTQTAQNFESLLWNFGDGNFSTESDPIHTYLSSDTINVILIAFNQCTSDTLERTIIINGKDEIINPDFKIAPNPVTNGGFTIFPAGLNGEYSIEIHDALGHIVLMQNKVTGPNSVSIHGLADGVYILKICRKEESWFYRLVFDSDR